jgi:hypothetical protein
MRKILIYSFWVAFIALAGVIYTMFSHGVTSIFMSYAFIWCLIGFLLKEVIDTFITLKLKPWVHQLHKGLWWSYVINATLGSIIIGIIEIAGSFTNLLYFQLIFGLISLVGYILLSILILWTIR